MHVYTAAVFRQRDSSRAHNCRELGSPDVARESYVNIDVTLRSPHIAYGTERAIQGWKTGGGGGGGEGEGEGRVWGNTSHVTALR